MYARPELSQAHQDLWSNIRNELSSLPLDLPTELDQDKEGLDAWRDPRMIFSQTCGRPLKLALSNEVTLIGTPDYDLPDCRAGFYYSHVVTRSADPRNELSDFSQSKLAINAYLSQSGWAAMDALSQRCGFQFNNIVETGAHRNSAMAVAEGRADIAAIDALTWRYLETYEDISALKVIARTTPTPGLPYITNKSQSGSLWFDAVSKAIEKLNEASRSSLGIKALVSISLSDYMNLHEPSRSKP